MCDLCDLMLSAACDPPTDLLSPVIGHNPVAASIFITPRLTFVIIYRFRLMFSIYFFFIEVVNFHRNSCIL